jgi:hypothetical protein
VWISGLAAQETIILNRPAIWIHDSEKEFREIFTLQEGQSVFSPVVTDKHVIFSVGPYGEYINEGIIYRKSDGALFHVYRDGLLMSNTAIGEYLFKVNRDESFEVIELTNDGELKSVKKLFIPDRGITYYADHYLVNDTLNDKLVYITT